MKIEFVSTGDEVLSGQIIDTNAAWVSQSFLQQGREITRRHTVADDMESLVDIITETSFRADIVIINGGLGPTCDDLSAEAAAKALSVPLALNQHWFEHLTNKYLQTGRYLSKSNEKQAWLPEGCELIDNPVGTACGFSFVFNKARFYFTPGVPSEFKVMVTDQVIPDIQQRFQSITVPQLIRLNCFGISESALSERLNALSLPDSIKLGFRAVLPTIEIKLLSASSIDLDMAVKLIKAELSDFIFSDSGDTLAEEIHRLLLLQHHTLSLAESCTGGMIASELVAMSGSSGYLDSSHVTYSNMAKQRLVGVQVKTLDSFGAVSTEVVAEMAQGARERADVDFALAVSGIAGPSGGSDEKPVGTVAFSLATKDKTYTQLMFIPRWGRQGIRVVSQYLALDMLRRELQGYDVFADYGIINRIDSAVLIDNLD